MKELFRSVMVWILILCLLPAGAAIEREQGTQTEQASAQTVPDITLPSDSIIILSEENGSYTDMDIEEYTVYALLAQIPYKLHPEAMKAQACAARTYAAKRILSGVGENGAHMTYDSHAYQICLTDEQARILYKDEYDEMISAAKKAVSETKGMIITYEGSPITAAFHTSSVYMTEAAENVWGTPLPYLVPVSCPEEPSITEKIFTRAELEARMKAENDNACGFDGITLDVTPSGTVRTASLCGITLDGRELARLLTLDSAAFIVTHDDSIITFSVKGTGHLAGMSMCGADKMAENGSDLKEILGYYYKNTEISKLTHDST